MRIGGEEALATPPAAILAVLRDPTELAAALPGVEELELVAGEEGAFTALIRPALALGEVPIKSRWRLRSLGDEALHYSVAGRTGEHRLELEATVELRDGESGGATAVWSVEFATTGTMRSAGQRTIAAIVAAQARLVLAAAGRVAAG